MSSLVRDPDLKRVRPVLTAVQERAPLVHCLSAAVSMGIVADGLLAAGARPMMTETLDEAPHMVTLANALLINLGTLSTDGSEGIPATVEAAQGLGLPWVLDPAAVGVAPVRTAMARRLLKRHPAVVRANASEVLALAGEAGGAGGRGADSTAVPDEATRAARQVSALTGGVVAISGAADLLIDARRELRVARGTPLLTRVTGTGCLLGALTAACLGAGVAPLEAADAATVWIAVAGELAETRAPRPGSFRTALLDSLDEVAL